MLCCRIIYNTPFAQNQYSTRVIFDRVKSSDLGEIIRSLVNFTVKIMQVSMQDF